MDVLYGAHYCLHVLQFSAIVITTILHAHCQERLMGIRASVENDRIEGGAGRAVL